MNPTLFPFLGFYPTGLKYNRTEQILIDLCLLHAKKSIALFWKKVNRPNITFWIRQMLTALPLEKINIYAERETGLV